MPVTIRLTRQGAKKQPNYLIVVVDSAKKRDGEYLAKLGQYFPKAKTAAEKVKVDVEAYKNGGPKAPWPPKRLDNCSNRLQNKRLQLQVVRSIVFRALVR